MRRVILTGAPGAGKTVLLRELERLGYPVVEEAATDLIALEQARGVSRPWDDPGFLERVVDLQVRRIEMVAPAPLQFHDRSLACTAALAEWLGRPTPPALDEAILRTRDLFDSRVIFVRLLDFITPTAARKITLEQSRRFEAVHEAVYQRYGFALVDIPAEDVHARVRRVLDAVRPDLASSGN